MAQRFLTPNFAIKKYDVSFNSIYENANCFQTARWVPDPDEVYIMATVTGESGDKIELETEKGTVGDRQTDRLTDRQTDKHGNCKRLDRLICIDKPADRQQDR